MNGIGVGGYHAIPHNTKQYRAKYNEWHRCWGLGTAGASSRFRWPRLTTAHLINGRAGLKLVRDPDFDLRSGPVSLIHNWVEQWAGGWASVKLASTQSSDLVRVRARLDKHSGILLVMVTLSLWWLVGPINTNLMLSNIVNFNEYCKVKVNQRLQLGRQNRNKYYCEASETCVVYSTTFKLYHLRGEAYLSDPCAHGVRSLGRLLSMSRFWNLVKTVNVVNVVKT